MGTRPAQSSEGPRRPLCLGIEAGGSRTRVRQIDGDDHSHASLDLGPANLRLLSDAELVAHFRRIGDQLPGPDAIAIGMAGAKTAPDRERIRRAADRIWPGTPCYATDDLETSLMAPDYGRPEASDLQRGRVLVVSGTGAACRGLSPCGDRIKMGGWGHLLGDRGSGYQIGLEALKAVLREYDHTTQWPPLGEHVARALQLNDPNDWIDWTQQATKAEIAALAGTVFDAWHEGDPTAERVLNQAVWDLAQDSDHCARRLADRCGDRVEFFFGGSILLRQPRFRQRVEALLRESWRRARMEPLPIDGVFGALLLAKRLLASNHDAATSEIGSRPQTDGPPASFGGAGLRGPRFLDRSDVGDSPTEKRHPGSWHLDRLSIPDAIELMLSEEAHVAAAVLKEKGRLGRVIRKVVRTFQKGGRLFYVGAGTSGRLGVLDAAECPPTFHTDPGLVQAIIAGGRSAIWEAIEGAEDDFDAGGAAIRYRGVRPADMVVGIAASGRTPFVWGALTAAKQQGSPTALICFNPKIRVARSDKPDELLAPDLGPEILTGSTRLKAGTATKLILNCISTLAMVQTGKVLSNLMVNVTPTSEKLRQRAIRILAELTGLDQSQAGEQLEAADWSIPAAYARIRPKKHRPKKKGSE